MKKLSTPIPIALVINALCCLCTIPTQGQALKLTLLQSTTNVCVQVVPQFTDPSSCFHGGNAVLITPTSVTIEPADITNSLGTWSVVSDADFMGIHFYQFGSESLSTNRSFTNGTPVTLFCVAIANSECPNGEMVRLMEQVDHNTPVGSDPDFSLYGFGVQHALVASLAGNCNPESGTVFDGLTGTTSIPCTALVLPVELVDFDGEWEGNDARLRWSTATEVDNDYFVLERSTDGLHFEPIAKVEGAGTTFDQQHYTWLDKEVAGAGQFYYRLLQTDFDGRETLSKVVALERKEGKQGAGRFSLFPNPTTGRFRLLYDGQADEMGATVASLSSMDGKLILQHPLVGISTQFDLTALPSGSYLLTLADATGTLQRLPVVLID